MLVKNLNKKQHVSLSRRFNKKSSKKFTYKHQRLGLSYLNDLFNKSILFKNEKKKHLKLFYFFSLFVNLYKIHFKELA